MVRSRKAALCLVISLFFEKQLGVFAPFRNRGLVLLNELAKGLAQSGKVKCPKMFALIVVQRHFTSPIESMVLPPN